MDSTGEVVKQNSPAVPQRQASEKRRRAYAHTKLALIVIGVIGVITILGSFTLGHYYVSVPDVLAVISNAVFGTNIETAAVNNTVIMQVRLPRIVAALFIGAALASAGASYQGLFKNPMVSPDLLGASAGAGCGACLALLANGSNLEVQLAAFLGGITAVCLTYAISAVVSRGGSMTLCLVLTGMVVAALFQAVITMSKFAADPNDRLPAITFWLMGSLATTQLTDLPKLVIPTLVGVVPMILFRYQLNALSFGDEEARSLGANTRFIRLLFIVCATLVTSSAVAMVGMVGWVGLVIPHLARMIVGPNYKVLLPTSTLLGAVYLLIIDDLCRCLLAVELPLSVLTAVIGAPFFIYLLMRGRKTWA